MSSLLNLKKQTLEELYDARTLMESTTWELELEDQSEEVRKEAGIRKMQTQLAILKLENGKLNDLKNDIIANEKELEDSTTALSKAKQNLDNISDFVKALSNFLNVIAKITAKVTLPSF